MRTWLGLAVSLIFLFLFLRQLDLQATLSSLRQAQIGWLLMAVLVLAADFSVRIFRWALLLRTFNPDLHMRQAAGPFLASFALNNVVPLRAGDIARAFAFTEHLQTDSGAVTATLIIERVLDLGTLLLLFCLGLLWFPSTTALDNAAYLAIALLFLGMISLLSAPLFWQRLFRKLPLPEGKLSQFADSVFTALASFSGLLRWSKLVLLSLLAWLLEGGVFYCVAQSIMALSHTLAPWFALALGSLSTLLPSSPGYLGTFDYFTAMGFSLTGSSPALASASALLIHLVLWLPVTLAGFLWLARAWGGGLPKQLQGLRERGKNSGE